jgi:hypothetical protein
MAIIVTLDDVPLRAFLGYGPVALMGVAMALSDLTLATWLLAKVSTNGTVRFLPDGKVRCSRCEALRAVRR